MAPKSHLHLYSLGFTMIIEWRCDVMVGRKSRLDEPVAAVSQDNEHSSLVVTRATSSRSIARRLESSLRAVLRSAQAMTNLPSATPAHC